MDCYTRRNIQDAVLESQAFGPYTPPDFAALAAAAAAAADSAAAALSLPPPALQPPPLPTSPAPAVAAAPGPPAAALSPATALAAAGAPPPSPEQQEAERKGVVWVERVLIPAINRQGDGGWDILRAVEDVRQRAAAAADEVSLKAVGALEARVKEVGREGAGRGPQQSRGQRFGSGLAWASMVLGGGVGGRRWRSGSQRCASSRSGEGA